MTRPLLAAVLAIALAGCKTTLPGVPANERPPAESEDRPAASSARSCKRDAECGKNERCHYYRFCTEDNPANCPPPKGDLQCHKNCEDSPCPRGESCREVPVAYGDHQTEARLCF